MTRDLIFADINAERDKQHLRWGEQHRPNTKEGVDVAAVSHVRDRLRQLCNQAEEDGPMSGYTGGASWQHILDEEIYEAYAEMHNKEAMREELIQAAAVIVAWIEDLDSH